MMLCSTATVVMETHRAELMILGPARQKTNPNRACLTPINLLGPSMHDGQKNFDMTMCKVRFGDYGI